MRFGFGEILLLAIVVVVLFGRGRIADIMGEFGKGLRSFKEGLKGEELTASDKSKVIEGQKKDT
jgi:sec-independent protein translocase protein TatA